MNKVIENARKRLAVFAGVIPNVAKTGGLQSQGAKGAAVVVYCKPLATLDLEPSGFPEG